MRKFWKRNKSRNLLPCLGELHHLENETLDEVYKPYEPWKELDKLKAAHKYDYMWIDGELQELDRGLGILILQLNLAGIKTLGSCSGHSNHGYPSVLCVPGTEEKLREFGCKIVTTRKDGKVIAHFPCRCFSGRIV